MIWKNLVCIGMNWYVLVCICMNGIIGISGMDGIKLAVSTEIYFQSCFFSKVLTFARAYIV